MKNTLYNFIVICVILVLISEITEKLLNSDILIYNFLSEKLTEKQIKNVFEFQSKWQCVEYLLIPFYVLLKTYINTSVLYIGIFFLAKETTFKSLFFKVLTGEFIFLLVPIFKIVWFYFFQTNYTLEDIQYFFPLSAINITGYKGIEAWLIYPLQTLNLFEVAYIIYLSYQIGTITKTSADNGLKIVGYSYVPALLLWVTVVMFFTLNNS